MKKITNQKGLTAISWMALLVVLGFIVLVFLKVAPMYFDSWKVADVLDSMKEERNLGEKTNGEISLMISKRLHVNLIEGVSRDDVYIDRGSELITIEIEYEVRRNVIGNLDVIATFKKKVEVPPI